MSRIINYNVDTVLVVRDVNNVNFYSKSNLTVFGNGISVVLVSGTTTVEQLDYTQITEPDLTSLSEYIDIIQGYIDEYVPPVPDPTIVLKGNTIGTPDTLIPIRIGTNLSITNNTLNAENSGGGGTWGSITGTLSNQTDLQNALNAKQTITTLLTAFVSLVTAADKIPYFTGLNTISQADFTSLARTMLALSNPSAVRFYKINADNTISLRTAAEMLADIGGQASGNYLVTTNNLSDVSNAGTARSNLGLVIGTNVQAWAALLDSWAAITRASGFDTFVATPSSANLLALLTTKTGTGNAVFADTPTLISPILGTPTSGNLVNATGYTEANLSMSDITTNNVSTTKHGFVPKATNTGLTVLLDTGAYGAVPSGNLVYSNTSVPAGNTVSNTAAETTFTLPSYSIPANALVAGSVIRVKLWGVYSTDGLLAPTITAKIKIAGTTYLTTGAITALVGVTNGGWSADAVFTIFSVGASGTVDAQGFLEFSTAATTSLTVNVKNTATQTIDTTVSNAITVTVQWGTADTDNTVTLRNAAIYVENLSTIATAGTFLQVANNLSDLNNAITARRVLVQEIYLTAGNQTTTSATAVNITELVTASLSANTRYYFEGYLHTGCNNTGGVMFATDIPASATMFIGYQGRAASAATMTSSTNTVDATLTAVAFNTFNSANGGVILKGEVGIVTAGVVQFMFASGVALQTSTIFQEGTFIKIYKLT